MSEALTSHGPSRMAEAPGSRTQPSRGQREATDFEDREGHRAPFASIVRAGQRAHHERFIITYGTADDREADPASGEVLGWRVVGRTPRMEGCRPRLERGRPVGRRSVFDQADIAGPRALLRVLGRELHALAVTQQFEDGAPDRTPMEEVLEAILVSDESEALVDEETCDRPGRHTSTSDAKSLGTHPGPGSDAAAVTVRRTGTPGAPWTGGAEICAKFREVPLGKSSRIVGAYDAVAFSFWPGGG